MTEQANATEQSPATNATPEPAVVDTPKVDVAAIVAKFKRSNGAKPATSLNAAVPGTPKPAEVKASEVEKPAAAAETSTPDLKSGTSTESKPVEEKPPVDELGELARATKARRLAAEESKRAKEEAAAAKANFERERDGLKEIQELRDLAKTNPVAALEKMGATPKQVADWIVKQGSPTNQVEVLEAKIAKLEKDAEAREQRATEAQTKAQEAAAQAEDRSKVAHFVATVSADPQYEAINKLQKMGLINLTQEAIKTRDWLLANREMLMARGEADPRTYGDPLIARIIEARLQKTYSAIKSEFASLTPSQVTQAPKDVQEPGQEKQPPRTLTSNLQSETVPKQDKPWKGKDRKAQNKILAEMLKKASRSA